MGSRKWFIGMIEIIGWVYEMIVFIEFCENRIKEKEEKLRKEDF